MSRGWTFGVELLLTISIEHCRGTGLSLVEVDLMLCFLEIDQATSISLHNNETQDSSELYDQAVEIVQTQSILTYGLVYLGGTDRAEYKAGHDRS